MAGIFENRKVRKKQQRFSAYTRIHQAGGEQLMSISERMEKLNCDNPIYLKNLVKSLEEAKDRKDIERIILYATELERYKVLCGYTPAVQQLEESMKRISDELHLNDDPTIQRALNATPEKKICTCDCQTCEHEEIDFTAAMQRGFTNIQGAISPTAAPNLEEGSRKAQYPEICSEACKFVTCPYRREENFKLPCKQQWRPLKRSFDPNEE